MEGMCNRNELKGKHPNDNDLIAFFVAIIIVGSYVAFKIYQ